MTKENVAKYKHDAAWLGALVLFIALTFGRVISGAQSISRMANLAQWDSIFQSVSSGKVLPYDPSLVQLLIPNYMLVAKLWKNGEIPLWNSYNACGVPLLADVQSCVFSPLHFLLACFPSMKTYNLLLVFEIALAAIGTFLIARLLKVASPYAFCAGLLYALCPYNLYYLELLSGTSASMLPLLYAAFIYASCNLSAGGVGLASVASAWFVLSGHPEGSLYGMIIAVILFLFWPVDFLKYAVRRLLALPIIAGIAVGLAAPMLFPFIEYLSCGDSYKYAGQGAAFVPWQALVLNLLSPCSSFSSPYLGTFAVFGLICLLLYGFRMMRYGFVKRINFSILLFAILGLALLLIIGKVGIIAALTQMVPLSYLITVYLVPSFLLLVVGLVVCGFEKIGDVFVGPSTMRFFLFVMVIAIVLAALPWLIQNLGCSLSAFNFDTTLPDLSVSRSLGVQLLMHLIMTLLGLLFLSTRVGFFMRNHRRLLAFSFAGATVMSMLATSRLSMPAQPKFDFPETEVIRFLQSHPGRVLSQLEHVFRPNANAVYGLESFKIHNPLLPKRFINFAVACGARIDEFRNQYFDKGSSAAINFASVKYVLTQFRDLPAPFRLRFTSSEGIRIYENVDALPPSYLSYSCRVVDTEKDALLAITDSAASGQPVTVVERRELKRNLPASMLRQSFEEKTKVVPVFPTVIGNSHRRYDVASRRDGFLVVTDTFTPGWSAFVDGRPAEIIHANYLFRAILLSPGLHVVEFSFIPISFFSGLLACAIAMLVLFWQFFKSWLT